MDQRKSVRSRNHAQATKSYGQIASNAQSHPLGAHGQRRECREMRGHETWPGATAEKTVVDSGYWTFEQRSLTVAEIAAPRRSSPRKVRRPGTSPPCSSPAGSTSGLVLTFDGAGFSKPWRKRQKPATVRAPLAVLDSARPDRIAKLVSSKTAEELIDELEETRHDKQLEHFPGAWNTGEHSITLASVEGPSVPVEITSSLSTTKSPAKASSGGQKKLKSIGRVKRSACVDIPTNRIFPTPNRVPNLHTEQLVEEAREGDARLGIDERIPGSVFSPSPHSGSRRDAQADSTLPSRALTSRALTSIAEMSTGLQRTHPERFGPDGHTELDTLIMQLLIALSGLFQLAKGRGASRAMYVIVWTGFRLLQRLFGKLSGRAKNDM